MRSTQPTVSAMADIVETKNTRTDLSVAVLKKQPGLEDVPDEELQKVFDTLK